MVRAPVFQTGDEGSTPFTRSIKNYNSKFLKKTPPQGNQVAFYRSVLAISTGRDWRICADRKNDRWRNAKLSLGEIFPLGINGTILAMADDKEEIKNATVSVAPQAAAEQIYKAVEEELDLSLKA